MEIGSLCELIDDNWGQRLYMDEIFPVKGPVYTVREIIEEDVVSIRLEEIINKKRYHQDKYGETSFLMRRFRELQPPMDISMLIEEYELV